MARTRRDVSYFNFTHHDPYEPSFHPLLPTFSRRLVVTLSCSDDAIPISANVYGSDLIYTLFPPFRIFFNWFRQPFLMIPFLVTRSMPDDVIDVTR
jgi:hypothetical protein